MRILGTIIKTSFILLIVFFGALNMENVNITYFYGEQYFVQVPMFVAIIAALFLGIIIAALLTVKEKFSIKKELKNLKKQLKESELELKKLRNLPLSEESVVVETPSE